MKAIKSLTIILITLLSISFASTEWVQLGAFDSPVPIEMNLLESSDDRLLFEVIVHGFETEDVVEDVDSTPTTFQRISIPEAAELTDSGDPALPFENYLFAAPNGVSFSIDVIADEYVELEDYYVLPAYEWTEDWGGNLAFIINDGSGEVYDTDGFFPNDMEELGANAGSQYLQDQRLVSASYIPFEFNPEDEILRVYTYSLVEIDFTGTASWSTSGVGPYEEMLANMAPNYVEISPAELQTNSASLYKYDYDQQVGSVAGECDYLVIAAKTFADMIDPEDDNNLDEELEKLLRWRSTDNDSPNGFDIMVANVDEIVKWAEDNENAVRSSFNNYEVAIMIDDFIEEVYDVATAPHTFGDKLSYLLIVGDSHSRNRETDGPWEPYTLTQNFEVPVTILNCTETTATVSDLPYACIDSRSLYDQAALNYPYYELDEYPDLKMGRITADDSLVNDGNMSDVRSAEDVMNDIAEKIYKYEENTAYNESWRDRFAYYYGFWGHPASNPVFEYQDNYLDQQGYTHESLFAIDYAYEDLMTDCRQAFIDMLSDGTSERVLCVQQHGDPRGFLAHQTQGDDGIFVVHNDTVEDIDVGNDLPVVYASTCSTADFCEYFYLDEGDKENAPDGLDNRCIAETWLRRPDNGILAYYGFTQLSRGESTTWVYDLLFDDYITELGQHWLWLTVYDVDRFISILLGDPASDIGDARVAPTRPNLSTSWARVEFSDQDSDIRDGDWPWLDAGDPKINVSVDIVNTGGASSPATTLVFTYYRVESNGSKTAFPNTESKNVPSLDPGESYTVQGICDQFTGIDPDHSSDWDYDFIVKAQVNTVANETNTDDNSVWFPDDDVVSYNETHGQGVDEETFTDSFDPQPMTFYNFVDNWPIKPTLPTITTSSGSYSAPVVLADLDLDGEDEIIVRTSSGYLCVLTGDGLTVSGWPKYVGLSGIAPTVGDIDADLSLEIVCAGGGKIHAFNHNGTTVSGWSTPLTGNPSTEIVLANLDASGKDEIIFGEGVYLYAYNGNSSPYTSWVDGWIHGRLEVASGGRTVQKVSVSDVDQFSSSLEVECLIAISSIDSGDPPPPIFTCYNATGTNLFEEELTGESSSTPYALDLGGSSDLETFYKTDTVGVLEALESDGGEYGSFTATTLNNETIITDIVHGTIGSGIDAVEVIAVIAHDGRINAWDLQGLDVATAENTRFNCPPLIADVDGANGPDFVGIYDDGMVRAFDFEGDEIEDYTFTIHDSSIRMGAIGNIDDDDEAEFVFVAGDKVIAIELVGLASDIQWGQYRHDASHDNAD